jgi:hypothetical protein
MLAIRSEARARASAVEKPPTIVTISRSSPNGFKASSGSFRQEADSRHLLGRIAKVIVGAKPTLCFVGSLSGSQPFGHWARLVTGIQRLPHIDCSARSN